jgi:hypothetical protein
MDNLMQVAEMMAWGSIALPFVLCGIVGLYAIIRVSLAN